MHESQTETTKQKSQMLWTDYSLSDYHMNSQVIPFSSCQ